MKFLKKRLILPCLLFTSLCAMEAPVVEDPIRDGIRLINEGIEALQTPQSMLAIPMLALMQQEQLKQNPLASTPQQAHALKIINGIERLVPIVERTREESLFNPEKGAITLKLLREMHETTQQIMLPRTPHPVFGGAASHSFLRNRLISLKNQLFSYLEDLSPDKGNPLNLVREGLETTTEVIHAPDMDGLLPKEADEFGVQNLLSALCHTGTALYRRHEKTRVERTPVEQLTERREQQKGPFGLDYSIETVERGSDWLEQQIEEREIVEAVHNFCEPKYADGSLNVEQQQQNLSLIKQSLDFAIEPDRNPATLAIVQKLPSILLRRVPDSTLPPEALESLKRPGDGFKPSDIARLSQKIWWEFSSWLGGDTPTEQVMWTYEKQQLLKEKVAALLTSRNAERVSSFAETGKKWFARGCSFVSKIATHVRNAQQKEDDALKPLQKLHAAIDEEID
jgi:hypothetical protein